MAISQPATDWPCPYNRGLELDGQVRRKGTAWVSGPVRRAISFAAADWPMSPDEACRTVAAVELRVIFEPGEPPCGHVVAMPAFRAGDGEPACPQPAAEIPFTGWLGLLRVLSDLVARAPDP